MNHKRILIVDDDQFILELLKQVLGKGGYESILTTNPSQAINLFKNEPTLVVILDLNMEELSGKDLMLKFFELGYKPIVIILTSENDINTAVELFKIGAYDYIVKPFNPAQLIKKIDTAFEFAELQIIKENVVKEREIRIEHQLNWNLFKENLIKKDSEKIDSGLMANMNTSLIQGAGIGMLAPLIQMIKQSLKEDGETYIVEKELMNLVFENVDFASRLTGLISDIDYIINNDLPKESHTVSQIHTIIQNIIAENSEFEKERNHTVVISQDTYSKSKLSLQINPDYFKKAIRELLLNAFKFSEPSTKIYILFEIIKEVFNISFLNTPEKNSLVKNGISSEYQSIIFEPFFRISRHVFEKFPTLDFGLGLCYVEKIIRNHKGNARVTNLKNFLDHSNSALINFSIEIPFEN